MATARGARSSGPDRGRHSSAVSVLVMVGLLLLVPACGSDDTASVRNGADGGDSSNNPPAAEVAELMNTLGAKRHRVPAADTARFVAIVQGGAGLDAADRSCAAPATVIVLQPDAAGAVTVERLGKMTGRITKAESQFGAAVAACLGPESAARVTAKTPSPDLDPTGLVEIGRALTVGEAASVGIPTSDAACVAETALGSVNDAELASALLGVDPAGAPDMVGALERCLAKDRLIDIAVAGRAAVEEYRACVKQQLDDAGARLAAGIGSSTTVPTGPTTTVTPCA